jgi:hypothetical protein
MEGISVEIIVIEGNCEILGTFTKLRKATISFLISVCSPLCLTDCLSAWNNSAPMGWIFMKFAI